MWDRKQVHGEASQNTHTHTEIEIWFGTLSREEYSWHGIPSDKQKIKQATK